MFIYCLLIQSYLRVQRCPQFPLKECAIFFASIWLYNLAIEGGQSVTVSGCGVGTSVGAGL